VVEEITKERLQNRVGDRRDSVFLEDPTIPEKFRAKLKDYFRSGYDRGHQVLSPFEMWTNPKVPAADAKISQEAMNETFYLTNISPQVYPFKSTTELRLVRDSIEIVLLFTTITSN
jgi:endonuclease G, mitochondrial